MKTRLILSILALATAPVLAHETGAPAGECHPPSSAAPATTPPIVVLPPGPTSAAPAMSDDAKFSNMDANGNGTLTKPEVAGSSELTKRFSNLDRNHDGKLNREEYGLRNTDWSERR